MPDTFAYYVAAYVVAALLFAGYVASLRYRARLLNGPDRRESPAAHREPGAEGREST